MAFSAASRMGSGSTYPGGNVCAVASRMRTASVAAIVSSDGLYNKLPVRKIMLRLLGLWTLLFIEGASLHAEAPPVAAESELRDLVERYVIDREALARRYPLQSAPHTF